MIGTYSVPLQNALCKYDTGFRVFQFAIFLSRAPDVLVCRLLGGFAEFSIESETQREKPKDVIKEQRKIRLNTLYLTNKVTNLTSKSITYLTALYLLTPLQINSHCIIYHSTKSLRGKPKYPPIGAVFVITHGVTVSGYS